MSIVYWVISAFTACSLGFLFAILPLILWIYSAWFMRGLDVFELSDTSPDVFWWWWWWWLFCFTGFAGFVAELFGFLSICYTCSWFLLASKLFAFTMLMSPIEGLAMMVDLEFLLTSGILLEMPPLIWFLGLKLLELFDCSCDYSDTCKACSF